MNAGPVYRHIEVEPLTPTIGATLHGVDLARPLTDDAFEEIHAAWMAHQVIFLRDQHISAEQHLAFGRRFGELHIHPAAPYAHGNPELMMIHTDKESFRQNGAGWHSDVSADEEPPLGSILHLETVPKHGGDTLFASMYEAYDTLSEPMRALLDGLTARHESDYTGQYGDHKPQREFPKASHPVIRTHPVTGRKALFVNAGFTRRIEGLSRTRKPCPARLPVRAHQEPGVPVPLPMAAPFHRHVGQPLRPTRRHLGLLPGNAKRHPGDGEGRSAVSLRGVC